MISFPPDFSDSVFLINKEEGMTSFDVIARLRRITRQKKMGHAGTLDKTAEGLLVICTGKATRLIRFLMDGDKTYSAVFRLGYCSDTCDREGDIVSAGDFSGITRENLEIALASFKGDILQKPPLYSALKINGKRASDLARAGKSPEMKERPVSIYRIDLLDYCQDTGLVTVEIDCSKGTYIRSIARDLGEKLGCGAMLEKLVRTRSGGYNLANAATIESLEKDGQSFMGTDFILKVDRAVAWMTRLDVTDRATSRILNGAGFAREDVLTASGTESPVAIFDDSKKLIAIADIDFDNWTVNYYAVFN